MPLLATVATTPCQRADAKGGTKPRHCVGGRGAHTQLFRVELLRAMDTFFLTPLKTSPSKMEETRMLTRETIFTDDNQKCLEVPF